jgi:hypothetical protein
MDGLTGWPLWALLPVMAGIAFVQNMAFTWVSRSRNSGDVGYHRWAAYASNALWFFCQGFIFVAGWAALAAGDFVRVGLVALVYVIATSEGSCFMMARLLKMETGKRRVGAR